MRPIAIVLFVVALSIAALTAVLMNRMLSAERAPTVAVQQPSGPPTEEILVAAVDIKPGVVVKAEDLRLAPWPASAIDPRYVRRIAGQDAKAAYIGTIARRLLLAGEPLTPQAVFRQDEAGVLAGMLSPGMRAVSISVTPTSDVAGWVLPQDHVDIVLNQDVGATTGRNGSQPLRGDMVRFASEVILSDVRVLAVDDKLAKADASANMAGKTVTLEVMPADAEKLLAASKLGELTLALRSLALETPQPPDPPGYTADVKASRALRAAIGEASGLPASISHFRDVRVNRGGSTSTQSFAN